MIIFFVSIYPDYLDIEKVSWLRKSFCLWKCDIEFDLTEDSLMSFLFLVRGYPVSIRKISWIHEYSNLTPIFGASIFYGLRSPECKTYKSLLISRFWIQLDFLPLQTEPSENQFSIEEINSNFPPTLTKLCNNSTQKALHKSS